MLYARVFTQILDSSLAEHWQSRHVFEDMLKLSEGGIVDMTRPALARRTNIPLEVINEALNILEGPDPLSRDPAEGGRRIIRLDEHRDWGWRIVNWEKYEAVRTLEHHRAVTRERVRRHRAKPGEQELPLASPSQSTDTDIDTEDVLSLRNRNGNAEALHSVTDEARAITEIIEHLNTRAHRHFNPKTEKSRRDIRTRLRAVRGDVAGVLKMIDRQCELWESRPNMVEYLRPSTLFGSHFHEYYDSRNEPIGGKTADGQEETAYERGLRKMGLKQ